MIVIGGGVIGLAAAWRLAERGMRVVVLERGEPGGGTSHVAAGMIAPVAEAEPGEEPLLRLGIEAARTYPEFVAELRECSGMDPGYLECGTLIAARDRDEAEALDRELQIRERFGLEVRRLRPSEARRLEPGLAPALRGALEVPHDHAIDPRKLSAALARAVGLSGGEVRSGVDVAGLHVDRASAVLGVQLRGGAGLWAAQVVIAAGVWSDSLAGLPDDARIPVRPVKGQILRMHDPTGPGLLTRVLRMPAAYVVPRGDGSYVVGATMEERGFDTTVTAGAMFELLRDASELLPGISELVIDEFISGLRPGTPDNAPVIGPGALPGLFWATGHFRNGVLLAPVTASLVVDAVLGGAPTEIPQAFSPRRFAGASLEVAGR